VRVGVTLGGLTRYMRGKVEFDRYCVCVRACVRARHGTGSHFVTQRPSDPGIQRPGDPVDPVTVL